MGGAANMLNAFASTHDHRRSCVSDKSSSNGVLSSAAGFIDNILTSRQSSKKPKSPNHERHDSRRPQSGYFEEQILENENQSGEYRDPDGATKRRSVFSRIKGKMQPSTSRSTASTTSSQNRDRDQQQSPLSRGRDRRPRSKQRTPDRSSGYYSTHYQTNGMHKVDSYSPPSPEADAADVERMLESAVDHHRREVVKCRKQLEYATRQPHTTLDDLQDLLDDMRDHDDALENALRTLKRAQDQCAANRRSAMPDLETPPAVDPLQENGHDYFNHFDYLARTPQQPEPRSSTIFAEFTGMHGMDPFAQSLHDQQHHFNGRAAPYPPGDVDEHTFDAAGYPPHGHYKEDHRHSVPSQASQRHYAYSASGPRPASTLVPPANMSKHPPTVLRPDEAWRLFQKYNNRWNAIASDDPKIPFPTRGLHAEALIGRDTLWAPDIDLHPANWSEEIVMQANTQAFFLGVVGLAPKYTSAPSGGRIEMGFDRRNASPEQIKALIDILKKEKMRWHSDRLGRRNKGRSGMNSSLQKDPKARAVFHAACELMSLAQEYT